MKTKTSIKKIYLIAVVTILGVIFGALILKPTNNSFTIINTLHQNQGTKSVVRSLSALCRSTVVNVSMVFLSGLTFYPLVFCLPLFTFRGIAFGYALANSAASSTVFVSLVTYFLITILLIVLLYSSLEFSYWNGSEKRIKLPVFTYKYLMICGAAIIIKFAPMLICCKLIK